MPELPEVTCSAYLLEQAIKKGTLLEIHSNIKNFDASLYAETLGKTIQSVTRRGKYIILDCSPSFLVIHLAMSGSIGKSEQLIDKRFVVYELVFSSCRIALSDPRKFLKLIPFSSKQALETYFASRLGEDALTITPETLFSLLKDKNMPIKLTLLDQSNISGMGNIYCNEALFEAKVSPFKKAKNVSIEEITAILESNYKRMNGVITLGKQQVDEGVYSFTEGYPPIDLQVYGRDGQACPRCHGFIKRIELGGRGTYFCSNCQKEKAGPYCVGITGRIHSGKSTVSSYLESKGYKKLDADVLAHQFYTTSEGFAFVKKHFEEACIKEGKVDIDNLREAVKKSSKLKKTLQKAVFLYVYKQMKERIEKASNTDRFVLDVPLLAISKIPSLCDYIIFIKAKEHLRRRRLEKEGKDAYALMAINNDYPDVKTEAIADLVLHNDEGLDELYLQLKERGL